MKQSIYFADNSEPTLQALESRGFYICPCCRFKGAKWIHFYRRDDGNREFHGSGYPCEIECRNTFSEKCIRCQIMDGFEDNNIHIFNDLNDMTDFISAHDLP